MTLQQNTEANRRNALAEIRWYAWRIVHHYRLNGGVPYTPETAIRFCDTKQAAEKDERILALVAMYRLLDAIKTENEPPESLKETISLTRRAWVVCHDFDETLRGDKLPGQ